MEKLNGAQKYSNLGPQNLGSKGGLAPPPRIRYWVFNRDAVVFKILYNCFFKFDLFDYIHNLFHCHESKRRGIVQYGNGMVHYNSDACKMGSL